MKTNFLIICLVFASLSSCNSQNLDKAKQKQGKNHPITNSEVHRKYDDKGNLIEFDSTYTSYYSSVEGDTIIMDSIPENFELFFNTHWPGIASNDFLEMDTTFTPGFFHKNFFEKQFIEQDEVMMKMMQEMDSIKNEFFKMHAQLTVPKEE